MSRTLKSIDLKTAVPGPKSQAILARIAKAVPRAATPWAPIAIAKAHGSLLQDVDGNTFIDVTGGIGVLNVGHTHERVVAAIKDQADQFLHTDFTLLPYGAYVDVAERLNARFPGAVPAKAIFFNSGAEAVENAVKIAKVATGRRAIISFEGGFHGRTLMAMTLTSKPKPYKAGLGSFAPDVYKAPFPYSYRCPIGAHEVDHVCGQACYEQIAHLFKVQVDPSEVAAIIVEPVQGEGGFVVPPPDFLRYLRDLTTAHGIMLICDEVQTGFGRTGTFFACEQSGVVPDLITIAKSVADGLPLSGVIGKSEVIDAPGDSTIGGTYVGNPVACRAASAVLDVFDEEDLLSQGRRLGVQMRARLEAMADRFPQIGQVRGLGPMLAIELVEDRATKTPAAKLTSRVQRRALSLGLLMLKAGIYDNVLRFLAPLNTPPAIADEAMDVLEEALAVEVVS